MQPSGLTRRPSPARPIGVPALVALALLLLLGGAGLLTPGAALGSTALAAACDGAAVRVKPDGGARLLARLPAGATVLAVARVSGTSWKVSCAGTSAGAAWWRITAVNGRTTQALYGVPSVYAATGLFRETRSVTLAAACAGVPLRSSTSVTATLRTRLAKGTRVTAIGTVTGGAWTTSCTGPRTTGTSWAVISAVAGTSVQALYGVPYLFVARGQLVTPPAPTPTPSPTPTPTPTPTPVPTPTPTLTPPPDPYLQGIDVSHWQGTIDWSGPAGDGKVFAFLKATDGNAGTDATYGTNRAGAEAAGLLVGAYHFARPSGVTLTLVDVQADGKAEADHFIDVAAPAVGELLPVLDLENNSAGLSTSLMQAWVGAFLDEVEVRTGVRALVYTSPSFWANNVGDTQLFAQLGSPLWLAHWTSGTPWVPGSNWGGHGWTFWQYGGGPVTGIGNGTTYNVDLDRYRYADFSPYLIATLPAPTPTPMPTPTP